MNDAKRTAEGDVYSDLCPLDVLENEGGPPIDRDILSDFGMDADLTATDKLMAHEGVGISVGYAMIGEDEFGYNG